MPTIDTVGKTDEALLTSAAGALPVSTGPTGYPLFNARPAKTKV